jgi:hypothetical protein
MKCYDINSNCWIDKLKYLDQYVKTNKSVAVSTIKKYNDLIRNGTLNESIAKLTPNFDLLILFEYHGDQRPLNNINELTIPTIVLYWNYKDNNLANYFYYPNWLFSTAELSNTMLTPTTEFLFNCACRNFNERPGKIYNYIQLKQKYYFDKILFSKYKSIYPLNESAIDFLTDIEIAKFTKEYNTWQPMNSIDATNSGLDLVTSMNSTNYNVYKTSLFHIVAETAVNKPLLSEKTYKIFAVGQIPIMCGPQHAVSHLRDLGFDMFDDIVDHSYYDNIYDSRERINAMHWILDHIATLDHNQLLINTATRRMNNFTHLKSANLKESLLNPIITYLNY